MIFKYQDKILNFYNYDETFEYFYKNKNISFIRLGDGEFRIIQGCGIYYQNKDKKLQERMTEILNDLKHSEKEHYKILIPNFDKEFLNKILFDNLDLSRIYLNQKFSMLIKDNNKLKEFWNNSNVVYVGAYCLYNKKIMDINNFINDNQLYNHKTLKNKYLDFCKIDNEFNNNIVEIVKPLTNSDEDLSFLKNLINYDYIYTLLVNKLPDKKNLLECIKSTTTEETLDRIFNNVNELIKIRTTFSNSWEFYDDYLKKCLEIPKDFKFILACGPMGKILGYDLIKNGYIVYDLGHFHRNF